MTTHLHLQQRWTAIQESAQNTRRGIPDTANVNSSGQAGLHNEFQVKCGVHQFNAHQLPLGLNMAGQLVPEPFTFAQSPDAHGKGTASSAIPWLELAAQSQAPIFQFVHPATLRDGSHGPEMSLVTLLQNELARNHEKARFFRVEEVQSPWLQENRGRARHFQIYIQWETPEGPTARSIRRVDLTLCSAPLQNGVCPASEIQHCADVFNAATQTAYMSNPQVKPIVMSTGGFGRSSCLGVYQSITQRMRKDALTLHEALNLADHMIATGKIYRGSRFVPSFQQYLQLREAIEAYWWAQNSQGQGPSLL